MAVMTRARRLADARWKDAKGRMTRALASDSSSFSLRSARRDGFAGLIGAIVNIPGEMAMGVLAGLNPIHALNTLMIGMPAAAVLGSTRLMMFDTTSAMVLVAAGSIGDRSGDERAQAMIVMALTAGLFQLVLGVLGLGQLNRFVSSAVMTGFLTGVAVLIVIGQLGDLTGYQSANASKIARTFDLLAHITQIDGPTTAIGIGSLLAMIGLRATRLARFNLLIALIAASIAAWLFRSIGSHPVALVNGLGTIPRSLPSLRIPALDMLPALILPGVAVGLVQAAGVAQRYPNPDGAESRASQDFLAQGVANIACGFVQGMPGGGSLSGTALNVAGGARTRWALLFQAAFVVLLVLIFSDLLGLIPMTALAALLIYMGASTIKVSGVRAVLVSTRTSASAMLVTFVATLVMPLEQAVLLGVILAAVLFLYRASTDIRLVQIVPEDGGFRECPPPAQLASDRVTMLDVYGSLFYAGARTVGRLLPSPRGASRAVVVLRLRGQSNLGVTFLDVASAYARQLQAGGGTLFLAGVDPAVKRQMAKTGHLREIGEDHVFKAGTLVGASTGAAFRAGQAWLGPQKAQSSARMPATVGMLRTAPNPYTQPHPLDGCPD